MVMSKLYKDMSLEEKKALRKRLDVGGGFRIVKQPRKIAKIRNEARKWIIKQLGQKCEDCKINNLIVLEIHRDGGHDDYPTGEQIKWYKKQKIPNDVKLLCANCHKIYHSQFSRFKREWGWRKKMMIRRGLNVRYIRVKGFGCLI